jgi:hypothetical protein
MTSIAAICKALLSGESLSIMDGFHKFSCTNLPREISRSIEQKFDCTISKLPIKFTSQYGQKGVYFEYRLNPRIDGNALAIQKMAKYIQENNGNPKSGAKTKKQLNETEKHKH